MTNTSGVAEQVLSLSKGGGALQGIGETSQPNLFSDTGRYTIPIATSPGRNGFGPALTLQYSSGNGYGPFGHPQHDHGLADWLGPSTWI